MAEVTQTTKGLDQTKTNMEKIKKISAIGLANDILFVKELLEHLKKPQKVTVQTTYKSRYLYGNTEKTDTEVYEIPSDIRELLIEYFEYALENLETMIKLYDKVHKIAKLILPALDLAKPKREYVESNGDDRNRYNINYYEFEVSTPYVVKFIREKNGRKYITVVFETKEVIDDEVSNKFKEIDRQIEYAKSFCPEISADSLEKLRKYLENGYYIEPYLNNSVTLKVGTMETSIADMRKTYELLCGKINEEEVRNEEDRFSSFKYVKITPITNSIIVYKSFYSHGWDTKAIYFLSPSNSEQLQLRSEE